jgi:hypothetical protein
MTRIVFASAALAVCGLTSWDCEEASASETLIRLCVSPAGEPRPALKYQLLPELAEMNPGNPVHHYLRAMMEHHDFIFDKDAFRRRELLLAMPLAEPPAHHLRRGGGFVLEEADAAARLDALDWQILPKLKTDGVGFLVQDLQVMRELARALAGRFRAEVAAGRLDQALRTAKTMFAMSRHLSEHPTYIADLVAIYVAFVAIEPLEEMLQKQRCPNLYWALTNLPSPLVSLDEGSRGERLWVGTEFRDLDEVAPLSADQLKKAIAYYDTLFGFPAKTVRAWLDERKKSERNLEAARRRLVENGLLEERLLGFPAEQVLLLDEKREMEARRDDFIKLLKLPAWQFEALHVRADPAESRALFAHAAVSGLLNVARQRSRLDQRIALLRHAEALRLHAAEHSAALPGALCEISVPLPDDPFTGKPFRYTVSGSTAHLQGSPPRGTETDPAFSVHYEVSVQD